LPELTLSHGQDSVPDRNQEGVVSLRLAIQAGQLGPQSASERLLPLRTRGLQHLIRCGIAILASPGFAFLFWVRGLWQPRLMHVDIDALLMLDLCDLQSHGIL
jgi:hypothetical protein